MALEESVGTIFQYHQQTIMRSLACVMLPFLLVLLAKIHHIGGQLYEENSFGKLRFLLTYLILSAAPY
jgi:hypothetical protein